MSAPAVVADGLSVRLGGALVLQDLAFEIPAGAFVACVGPNGAGKSTLIKAVLGTVEPSSGRLAVLAEPPGRSAAAIGYVPQRKTLDASFPALGGELVTTGLSGLWPFRGGLDPRVRRALERVGGGHLAERDVPQLSGGELQRVFLARALVREPRLVILDEPATGIDVTGEADMYGVLEDYQNESGATVLMATHDLDAAAHHASHVLLLARRQVAFGAPAEALSEGHLRRAFSHVGHAHPLTGGHGDA